MNIAPDLQLYGLPAQTLRDFLRHVALDAFSEEVLRSYLTLSAADAKVLLKAMLADGLVTCTEMSDER